MAARKSFEETPWAKELRTKAESRMQKSLDRAERLPRAQLTELIHDMHVQQIELEIQNEELREAQLQSQAAKSKAEEAYRKFYHLYHDAPVGYATLNNAGLITQINQTLLGMIGRPEIEVQDHPFFDFVDPRDRDGMRNRYRAFYKQPADKQLEVRLMTKGRRDTHVLIEGTHQLHHHGPNGLTGLEDIYVTVTDITRRKELELAQRDSEARLKEITGHIDLALWMTDLETGQLLHASPLFETIWEETVSELDVNPRIWIDRVVAEDRKRVREAYEQQGKTTDTFEMEYRISSDTGSLKDIRHQVFPVLDFDGLPTRLVSLAQDVSAEKAANRQLELLSNVIKNSGEAVMITDPDERILFVNDAFTRITGYRVDEVLGLTPRLLSSGRHDRDFYRDMWKALQESGGWHGEVWNKNKDGHIYPELITINMVRDEVGKVINFVSVFSDITRIKESEQRLREINTELEEFAYVTSHDLREPLRMISNYLSLLKKRINESLDEETGEFFDFAVDGAQRMDALIQDVLEYSRVGRRETRLENIDMRQLVERAMIQLRPGIEESAAEVRIGERIRSVRGYRLELERLAINLISNAIKYRSPKRPLEIDIDCRAERGMVVFMIKDNGMGIDPQFHDRIFRMFQRLHPREAFGGTGVGLAVCQKIVKTHGGRIWVESVPDEGSTFKFSLPMAKPI
ncbi:PAS domain S-box protein [Magnetospira sp. QH-2]|uniref:PAS domain S-box protein n=1 Tax=Magnetospira sp. (strain QH-2) TaxID=1288970 RepID=UPI0003E81274|nr:PAS domain S-box protein [Magnetospira sp. QH-2]CCQ74318.1 Putative signal transduction histidine kinase with PAS domain [Magnetospira sp. QH-2]